MYEHFIHHDMSSQCLDLCLITIFKKRFCIPSISYPLPPILLPKAKQVWLNMVQSSTSLNHMSHAAYLFYFMAHRYTVSDNSEEHDHCTWSWPPLRVLISTHHATKRFQYRLKQLLSFLQSQSNLTFGDAAQLLPCRLAVMTDSKSIPTNKKLVSLLVRISMI